MGHHSYRFLLLLFMGLNVACLPLSGYAQETLATCARKDDDPARLICYDKVSGRVKSSGAAPVANAEDAKKRADVAGAEKPAISGPKIGPVRTLEDAWSLGDATSIPISSFQSYRPTYFLFTKTSDVNELPTGRLPAMMPASYDRSEAKFQLSFKSEFISPQTLESLFRTRNWRLWVAYTQQSHWQIFDGSAPFRESNYEPEAILTYSNPNKESKLKLVNFGLVHQSNGRSGPESRSWNRAYLQGGWQENSKLSVLGRLWWRFPEDYASDDNPGITDYVGRGDLVLRYQPDEYSKFSLLGRHNLRFDSGKGFVQLDMATKHVPIGALRKWLNDSTAWLHFQISHGYGESLIDYNFKQSRIGIGLSFSDW
jgi:phospholipase A1